MSPCSVCFDRGHLKLFSHLVLLFLFFPRILINAYDVDEQDEIVFQAATTNVLKVGVAKLTRYLLYDVNPGEGFNLRRDVYMRIAHLATKLNAVGRDEWVVVLPPWGRIYHWKSREMGPQIRLPWSLFFDLESLRKYVPVIEFKQFLAVMQVPQIDELFYLQHYAEGWEDGKWEERMDIRPCIDPPSYELEEQLYKGWFWSYSNVYAKNFSCLSVQGHSSSLIPLLDKKNTKAVMIDRAEVILHDVFGDAEYWRIRRSMRFSSDLRHLGDTFRKTYLNSSDEADGTVLLSDWRLMQKSSGSASGGPYLAAHLRRADFLYGHKNEVPSLHHAAAQILNKLTELNLSTVFIASDATQQELSEITSYLTTPHTFLFSPSDDLRRKYKDGGIAIIDQWICSHARYFIGTHESTFSFRIQEEREILGFSPDTSFNRFCPDHQKSCTQPSRWQIVY